MLIYFLMKTIAPSFPVARHGSVLLWFVLVTLNEIVLTICRAGPVVSVDASGARPKRGGAREASERANRKAE